MKKIILILTILLPVNYIFANKPDSLYIKFFSTEKNNNKNGLHIAFSADKKHWQNIGDEFSFLKSDYGAWDNEKRMLNPQMRLQKDGTWICVFDVNERDNVQGITSSQDLVLWKPQDYFLKDKLPIDSFYDTNNENIFKLPHSFVENLINHVELTKYKNQLYSETTAQDGERFANLGKVDVKITLDFANYKKISDKFIGIFFEDINYAADGGLYAELIQNRDFEYSSADRKEWNATTAWKMENGEWAVENKNPLHINNQHYVVLPTGGRLINEGYDGIPLIKGEKYDFSIFARSAEAIRTSTLRIHLISENEEILAETILKINSNDWKRYSQVLIPNKTVSNARLAITAESGNVALDVISLFPQKTFKNRKSGLRADLAQALADLKPRFVRFPGGCVAHGQGIENIYHWKNSIGKLEERKPDFNIWGYHQTMGLGYFEYFQFCEDIGAEPLPVLAAGVPCQNSLKHNHALAGQQGGIPMEEMGAYIQDILDLIEWANGNKTTKWGKIRAEAGHPEPFNLKYIGIGNEDLISEVFKERFKMIFNAIQKTHPEITVIGTVGPFYEGSDYEFGWQFASQLDVPVVDEHYYVPPGWMIYNQDFYDNYDRNKPKVYLGEYAAHLPGRPNNLETALAEALHLCNVERNGDIVVMTSYAPLLAKEKHAQWNPDLIYFNNTEIKPTVGYYVQQLFGQNAGDEYIPTFTEISAKDEKVRARIVHSIVKNYEKGEIIIKLVNLLPVEAIVNFQNLNISDIKIEKTVLTGKPDSKTVKPVSETINLQENNISLPAYSFTILKVMDVTF